MQGKIKGIYLLDSGQLLNVHFADDSDLIVELSQHTVRCYVWILAEVVGVIVSEEKMEVFLIEWEDPSHWLNDN